MAHHIFLIFLVAAALITGCAAKSQMATQKPAQPQSPPSREMNPEAYHHFTNAVIYEEEGMFNDAVKEYELALSYEPLSYDIRLALGTLYLTVNKASLAVDALLPISPKDKDVFRMLGDAFRQSGQDLEAEQAYIRAWRIDSTDVNLNYYLGVYASVDQRLNEAAKYFRVAAQNSGNYQLYTQIAEMYSNVKQFDSAAVFMEAAIALNQADASLFSQQAVYQYSAGKKAESKNTLNRAITLFPNNPRVLAQLVETYNAENNIDSVRFYSERMLAINGIQPENKIIYERMGSVLLRAGERDLARRVFEKTLSTDPKNKFALFYLGRMEVDSSHFEIAKSYFNRLIAVDSSVADGWTNLAYAFQQQKHLDSAEQVLENAANYVVIDRDNVQLFLAQILSQREMGDSSISVLRNVIAEGGDTIRALFQIGAEYEKSKNLEKASETFELLLSIQPNHHQTLNYYGYMLADRGERLNEALAMIEIALKADPDNGAYLDSYAWVLYKMGQYDEALIQIQKAIKVTNNDPIVIEHLGDIQFALGNVESARDAWKTALAFDPGNKSLQEKLKK